MDAGVAAGAIRAGVDAGKNCRSAGRDVPRVLDGDADIAACTVGVALGDRVDAIGGTDFARSVDGNAGIATHAVSAAKNAGDKAAARRRQVARIVDSNADIAAVAKCIAERRRVDRAGIDHPVRHDGAGVGDGDARVAADPYSVAESERGMPVAAVMGPLLSMAIALLSPVA